MVSETAKNWLIFALVFIVFLPFLSKAVRLASRTWRERDHLPVNHVRKVLILVPLIILFAFTLFYFGVQFLVNTIEL